MATSTETALQVKELLPNYTVNDLPKSLAFFEALGFAVDEQKGIGTRLYVTTTQDIDQLAARVKKAGIRLDSEAHDTEWGRAFDVTEPSGFKVTISAHL